LAEREESGRSVTNEVGERLFLYEGKTLDQWLPAVVERIVERFDPLRVILFGSMARGEAGYHSDVDLLVVFDEVEWENKRKLTVDILRALADLPISKDVVVTDTDEIARRGDLVGTILRPALREGKVLYERG
jgi:predicted nucleotidyltransferase